MGTMSMHQTGQGTHPALNLWESALRDLEPEERDAISNHTQDTKPADVLEIVKNKRQEAWKNRISFKRSNGEVVFLHDIFAKVAQWVKKFVEVGDVAVQYDPVHAALPWATMRFILQVSINDIQRQTAVLESVEDVAQTIPLGAIYECLYLSNTSAAAESLKANLTKLYTFCWSSLAKALRYHDQSKTKRILKSVVDLDSDLSSSSKSIASQWTLVERSATLVRTEGLLSHISRSESHSDQLLKMINDIKTPVSRIETFAEEAHQILNEMQRERILNSISTIPYRQHHKRVSRNVLPGTGEWLLHHQVVRKWFSSSASEILWLHGIPGSGKSSLVSVVIEKLLAESTRNSSSHPVYFYCTRDPSEKERANPTHILRSILKQLSMPLSTAALPTCVVDEFNREYSLSLDLQDTLDLIIDIIKHRAITFIILDALDECDVKLRIELTKALETILQKSQSLVKIFVSSRNDLDLVCWLREYPNKEILSSDNEVDLAAYVDDEVDKRVDGSPRSLLSAGKISDVLRDDIKQTLKAQAQGMFRWVELQLQYLCKLFTEDDVRQRLGALPKDLMDIYHDIYQRNMLDLRDRDPQYEADAKKVFHLMLDSHALWDPVDMANMLDPAPNAASREPEKVFGLTFHLITHDKGLNGIRFAHLSVREFFETQLPGFTPRQNKEANALACLDYLEKTRDWEFRSLSFPSQYWFTIVWSLSTEEISEQLANRLIHFLVRDTRTYESWLRAKVEQHGYLSLEKCPSVNILNSDDGSTVFVACALGLADVLRCMIDANPSCVHARNSEGDSTLVVACKMARNTDVVSLLLQKGAAVNQPSGHKQNITALGAAFWSYEEPLIAVIRELLSKGADPNCRNDIDEASALYTAASRGLAEAVELLLTYHADPNLATGWRSETPLYAATYCRRGNYETVRKLLERGASVKVMEDVRNGALQNAVSAGAEDIVAKLLEFGADPNGLDVKDAEFNEMVPGRKKYDGEHLSLLFLAIRSGEERIAQHLLSRGANPVPRNRRERDALGPLFLSGDPELAKSILFAKNQDLDEAAIIQASRLLGEDDLITRLNILRQKWPNGQTLGELMDLAAKMGLLKVFKRLTDHSNSCWGILYDPAGVALSGTARRGQVEMFKILWKSLLRNNPTYSIENDSLFSQSGLNNGFLGWFHTDLSEGGSRSRYSCLLHDAAIGGATDIFQLILDDGATAIRTETSDELFGTAGSSSTHSAGAIGNPGSTVHEVQHHGAWYLNAAVKAGKAAMVQFLLRNGADANAVRPDCDNQNALCTALLHTQCSAMVELLIKGGADVNTRVVDENGQTSHRDSTESADIIAVDEEQRTILQLAISKRRLRATELLLAGGADVKTGGGKYGSPLITAVEYADMSTTGTEIIEAVLKNGADVNAEYQGKYETAFRASLAREGSFGVQILRLLMSYGGDMSAAGRDGTQALYFACATTFQANLKAEFMLSQGADVNASGGEYGNPLQAICAVQKDRALVELLIANGAEVNANGGRFGNALQAASYGGSSRTMEVLLEKGADVHANGGEYGYALQAAAISWNPISTMRLLFSCGADVHAFGGKFGTVLQAACANSELSSAKSAVKFLIEKGADVNRCGGDFSYALICAAARHSLCFHDLQTDIIEILLDAGAHINCSDNVYGNALYAASESSSMHMMELLVKRGISLTQLAGEHEHALFVACLKAKPRYKDDPGAKDDKRVRLLLDNGVDVNIPGKRYSCALEVAIKADNFDAAKLLIERGANVRVETENDGSLLDIAIQSSSSEMVELLRANGA